MIGPSAFRPLELLHHTAFQELVDRHQPLSSHYNFASLYCWRHVYQTQCLFHGDSLYLYNGREDILRFPLGPTPDPDTLVQLSDRFRAEGRSGIITLAPPEWVALHQDVNTLFRLERDDPNADYIYSSSKLTELSGKKLLKKKNHITRFKSQYPNHAVQMLQPSQWPRCQEMADRWNREKYGQPLDRSEEFHALQAAFTHCHLLELQGFGLEVEGQLVAFSIAAPQNRTCATILFEKFTTSIQGSSQMINWIAASHLAPHLPWINREQDMGLPGLRQAKRSYDPDTYLWGYRLVPLWD